ncbi:MAG TPA: hypothetical protein VJV79_32920 [Polyangiaceae bacterium]|nr:hypothetical protein [Polyangiaceae bacterium]
MRSSWAGMAACLWALAPLACTVGEGEGRVSSDHIWVAGCWDGAFELSPDFFGANPDPGESLTIRVQRGDNIEDMSDGLIVLVSDLPEVRQKLGQDLPVGMPRGVSPPGVPVVFQDEPPQVSLSLYLHNSCHLQNGTIYSISGTINFSSLFSGDLNEQSSERRLTDATFDANFADPRELAYAKSDAEARAVTSRVTGNFRFFFQRGQPSQPFQ